MDLVNHALLQGLHHRQRLAALARRRGRAATSGPRRAAIRFLYLLAIEAALDGQGVALAPHFMVAEDLKIGPPGPPLSRSRCASRHAGTLVCPAERRSDAPSKPFGLWLTNEVAADPAMLRAA